VRRNRRPLVERFDPGAPDGIEQLRDHLACMGCALLLVALLIWEPRIALFLVALGG
jgi:hypothetical protein